MNKKFSKLTSILAALTMVMAMCTSAFAADTELGCAAVYEKEGPSASAITYLQSETAGGSLTKNDNATALGSEVSFVADTTEHYFVRVPATCSITDDEGDVNVFEITVDSTFGADKVLNVDVPESATLSLTGANGHTYTCTADIDFGAVEINGESVDSTYATQGEYGSTLNQDCGVQDFALEGSFERTSNNAVCNMRINKPANIVLGSWSGIITYDVTLAPAAVN